MTLVYLSLAWTCGIVLADWLWGRSLLGCSMPAWPFAALGAAVAGIALLLRRRRGPRLAAALAFFIVLGGWRYQTHPLAACPTDGDIEFYNGDAGRPVEAIVTGVVVGYPDVGDLRTQYRLQTESLEIGGVQRSIRGIVLFTTSRYPPYSYGDLLRVTGHLEAPPIFDDFDYRAYLARDGIHSILRQARVERLAQGQGHPLKATLYALRSQGAGLLDRVLPEPAAGLAKGILLGIGGGISPELDEAFKVSGTAHVNVISGSNISLLSGVIIALLGRLLGRRRALLPAIAIIVIYVLLVGAEAAALRAGLMGILYILAVYLGRQNTAYVSLCAAALLMTALNPLALWDIGFQLSFMATMGLTLFCPGLAAWVRHLLEQVLGQNRARGVADFLYEAVVATLAAQITLLPLLILHFGRLSPISFLANFLILPAQPPIMAGGLATMLAGLIWEPAGRVLAVIPWLFLSYTTAVVRLAAGVPWASLPVGEIGRSLVWIFYAILFGAIGWRHFRTGSRLSEGAGRAALLAGAITAPLWLCLAVVGAMPDGHLHVTFVPAETGEAVLIITPGGQRAWIWDGNGDGLRLAAETRPLLTGVSPDVDMAIGANAAALWPDAQPIDPATLAPGTIIRLEKNVTLTRLGADRLWAWLVNYGDFSTLLPVGLDPEVQAAVLAEHDAHPLRLTLLKTYDPQGATWPTRAFLAEISSQIVLRPLADDGNSPGDALASEGAARVPAGAIVVATTDGRRVWLKTLRGQAGF